MRRPAFADVVTGILALCAVTVTGLLIRREFRPPVAQAAAPPVQNVDHWREYGSAGERTGPAQAPVTIVEFADFQCPFCRQSAQQVSDLLDSMPGKVVHVYRHYPLTGIHPHAMMAAVAAECSARQGKFRAMHDRLFAEQDSIGKRSWTLIAADAGVPDTGSFGQCLRDSAAVTPRIRADIAAGSKLGVTGTPVLLVNEKLVIGLPGGQQLHELVDRAMKK
jgi:protein-disulfide isomerase